jgi:hypothetical protein
MEPFYKAPSRSLASIPGKVRKFPDSPEASASVSRCKGFDREDGYGRVELPRRGFESEARRGPENRLGEWQVDVHRGPRASDCRPCHALESRKVRTFLGMNACELER